MNAKIAASSWSTNITMFIAKLAATAMSAENRYRFICLNSQAGHVKKLRVSTGRRCRQRASPA